VSKSFNSTRSSRCSGLQRACTRAVVLVVATVWPPCRSGNLRTFTSNDALPVAPDTGNLAGSEAGKLVEGELPGYQDNYVVVAPVGKFTPNALGLQDIGGNVSEWTNDFYLSFVDTRDSVDPLGPDQAGKHVIRGANWRSSAVSELRLAWRDSGEEPSPTIGFRIARYAE